MHPEIAPISVIAALSLLLPLPWHWRARNVATLSIIGWLFFVNIIYAVDALLWGNNLRIIIPVWCDITTKFVIGANFALPAACLCICIHLEQVASVRMARTSGAEKRRRQWFELGMCIGLPIVFMALHYIVQGHRYDLIEGYGCRPTTYFSIPSIFIVWVPPILISVAAVIYAGLALRHFVIRRISFASHLNGSNSALTPSRYLRLMTMSALQMISAITVTSYNLWFTAMAVPIRPWTTWSDVHSDFLRVDVYPDLLTPDFVKRAFYVVWLFVPFATFLFVAFFSFGKDAMDEYKKCWIWLRVNILRINPTDSKVIRLSNTKHPRDLPISSPIQSKSTLDSGFSASTPPAYRLSNSSFSRDVKPSLSEHTSDTQSELTHYESSPYGEGKAIGSYADLSLRTPTTAGPLTPYFELPVSEPLPETPGMPSELPHTFPSPITPPPANPRRLRELILVPSSPAPSRPVSYPSFEAASPRTVQPLQPFTL